MKHETAKPDVLGYEDSADVHQWDAHSPLDCGSVAERSAQNRGLTSHETELYIAGWLDYVIEESAHFASVGVSK